MDKEYLNALIRKYADGACSPQEIGILSEHFDVAGDDQALNQVISAYLAEEELYDEKTRQDAQRIAEEAYQHIKNSLVKRKTLLNRVLYLKIAAAAMLLAVLAITIYFNRNSLSGRASLIAGQKIGPGGNRASLILPDGTKITLDSAQSGIIISGAENIKYTNGVSVLAEKARGPRAPGIIVSDPLRSSGSTLRSENRKSEIVNNILSTPKGGQYQVILQDGTKVLLNAESTLKYPSRFSESSRTVELEGEGFFQIKEDRTKPFRVVSKNQVVTVLGTSFNVTAYADEPSVKTTLVTGAIQVANKRLLPGQQAINNHENIQVKAVNINDELAWKNGYFQFKSQDIHRVMRSIARWYDIEVVYQAPSPTDTFGGSISRFENVSEVLHLLELTGKVHFKIEGRKIIVSK